jgi:hypothetical protein
MKDKIDTIMHELIVGKDGLAWESAITQLSQTEKAEFYKNIQKNTLDRIFHYLIRNDLSFEDMAKVLASKAHRHMNSEDQTLAVAIDYAIAHKNEIYKELLKQRPFLP